MTNLILLIFIQIVAESLPISSSSHTYLLTQFMHLPELPTFFDHFLHGPTLLILLIFFRTDVMLLYKLFTAPRASRKRLFRIFTSVMKLLAITTPLAVIGYELVHGPLASFIEKHYPILMLVGLCATALLLYSLYYRRSYYGEKKDTCLTLQDALILGSVQALALLPGISRFAATFVTARWLGYPWQRAFQLCFLIEVPLITAAFFIKGIPSLFKHPQTLSFFTLPVMITFMVATVLGYAALYGCWRLAQKNVLWLFCWYMILPTIITLGLLIW